MLKKALLVFTVICASLFLFSSCDFLENELELRSSSRRGKSTTQTITVLANAVEKNYNPISSEPDPPLTFKTSPESLPSGVSITGELERDSGEVVGSYAIRQGTLALTGTNAGKYKLFFVGNFLEIKIVNP